METDKIETSLLFQLGQDRRELIQEREMGDCNSDRNNGFQRRRTMKVRYLPAIVIILSLMGVSYAAMDWEITDGSEIIQEGDEYSKVSIYNSAMVEMSGGVVSGIDAYNSSTLTLRGGSVGARGLYTYNSSVVNIHGWTDGLKVVANDSSTVNLFQGNTNGSVNPYGSSTVHIYGTDFDFSVNISSGTLTGKWADETDFSLFFRGETELPSQVILHQVPEPTTLILLLSGIAAIHYKRM